MFMFSSNERSVPRKVRWVSMVLALMLALSFVSSALGEPAQAEKSTIEIQYGDEVITGTLGIVGIDDRWGKMTVSFLCEDLQDHIKMETSDGGLSIIVPVLAQISVNGETLKAVDATFYQAEAFWFFDTEQKPDTVTFYPHGDDDPAKAVTVDAVSGVILGEEETSSPAAEPEPMAEPEPAQEPAPASEVAPEAEPTQAAVPASGGYDIAALLGELREAASDPWEQAIYGAGADTISQNDESITFALRSYDPKLKSLPKYEDDQQLWLDSLFENVRTHDLELTLALANGEADSASLKSLKSKVAAAAKEAKAGFDQKSVRVALAELLLPTPVHDDAAASGWGEIDAVYHELVSSNPAFEGLDSVQFTPLFYAQTKQTLNVKDGPHALTLNCTGANPEELIEDARKSLLDRLSKVYKSNEMGEYEIEEAFADTLAEKAAAIRKKGSYAYALTLDIDAVMEGDFGADYAAYMQSFDPEPALISLISDVQALPDAPAQPFPKSGRISGSKSGTKVIIKAPKDDMGRYVQMRNSDSDEMTVDLFITSGGSATVYVPQGMYYLLIASGETWYGVEGLFGDNGSYSETAETEILSKKYYHTLTLNAGEGDISMYGSSPSAFR